MSPRKPRTRNDAGRQLGPAVREVDRLHPGHQPAHRRESAPGPPPPAPSLAPRGPNEAPHRRDVSETSDDSDEGFDPDAFSEEVWDVFRSDEEEEPEPDPTDFHAESDDEGWD